MARIFIGTFSAIGHVNPFLPLARALVARGHEVLWNTSATFGERIEATGARFVASKYARDFGTFSRQQVVDGGENLKGMAALKVDLKYGFIDNAPAQLRDVQAIMPDFRADLILIDPGFIGGFFYAELSGTPFAVLNVTPLGLSSCDTAPNGLGLAPNAFALGRLRNRGLQWAVEHLLFRDVQQHWNAVRASLGLPKTGWLFDVAASQSTSFFMQPTVPGFEYPRSDLPPHVHFIGMLPAEAPRDWARPDWWDELDGTRPVVHVTQGTVANQRPELIAPVLAGLAGEDVLVVVTGGGRSLATMGLDLPGNARGATYLSYPELLPRIAAMVTNGGYGGVQTALSHGVPLAVAGVTEDKPEVAARVAWSGVGINLKTAAPSPKQVRRAVRALLDDSRYRERARALQAEYARYDAVRIGVDLVERLVGPGPMAASPDRIEWNSLSSPPERRRWRVCKNINRTRPVLATGAIREHH